MEVRKAFGGLGPGMESRKKLTIKEDGTVYDGDIKLDLNIKTDRKLIHMAWAKQAMAEGLSTRINYRGSDYGFIIANAQLGVEAEEIVISLAPETFGEPVLNSQDMISKFILDHTSALKIAKVREEFCKL